MKKKQVIIYAICAVVALSIIGRIVSPSPTDNPEEAMESTKNPEFTEGIEFTFDTEKAAELRAQYDFYDESVQKINKNMDVSPEEADNVFTVLVEHCGLDEEISYVFKNTDYKTKEEYFKVWWALNSVDIYIGDGRLDKIVKNSTLLYPVAPEITSAEPSTVAPTTVPPTSAPTQPPTTTEAPTQPTTPVPTQPPTTAPPTAAPTTMPPTQPPTNPPPTTETPTQPPTPAPTQPPTNPPKKWSGIHKDENMNVVTPLSDMDRFVVFWGNTGDRVHIDPDCRTFKNGVLFGSLDDARNAGRGEWCGTCSKGYRGKDGREGDEKFRAEGNPKIK